MNSTQKLCSSDKFAYSFVSPYSKSKCNFSIKVKPPKVLSSADLHIKGNKEEMSDIVKDLVDKKRQEVRNESILDPGMLQFFDGRREFLRLRFNTPQGWVVVEELKRMNGAREASLLNFVYSVLFDRREDRERFKKFKGFLSRVTHIPQENIFVENMFCRSLTQKVLGERKV